jgi:hypothetical protein
MSVFEKNANFIRRKLSKIAKKIVIITSTPGHTVSRSGKSSRRRRLK